MSETYKDAETSQVFFLVGGAGSSFMLVNGIPTDMGNFDLYTLMEQIRKEVTPCFSHNAHSC